MFAKPLPNWTVPSAYSGAAVSMTKNLALDLRPVRVNIVSAGAVATELWDPLPPAVKAEWERLVKEKTTIGEVGRVEDVVEAYLFSMKNRNCSGAVIETNGGSFLL
jgi:NAD(P)-dependent dehydrogenase (short-subunit alcohol dehydrogenase family)